MKKSIDYFVVFGLDGIIFAAGAVFEKRLEVSAILAGFSILFLIISVIAAAKIIFKNQKNS